MLPLTTLQHAPTSPEASREKTRVPVAALVVVVDGQNSHQLQAARQDHLGRLHRLPAAEAQGPPAPSPTGSGTPFPPGDQVRSLRLLAVQRGPPNLRRMFGQ